MAQSNCGRGGRMAPPGSNKRMGAKAGFVPRFRHHDTRRPPSIFLAQKTGTLADFPIRHRGRAYILNHKSHKGKITRAEVDKLQKAYEDGLDIIAEVYDDIEEEGVVDVKSSSSTLN